MLDQDVHCVWPTDRFVKRKKKAAAAAGGKKGTKYSKDYTEGWVEFRDKRIAKRVAASLHNTPMGARKRSPFRYDLWNLKVRVSVCLPHFLSSLQLLFRHPSLLASPKKLSVSSPVLPYLDLFFLVFLPTVFASFYLVPPQ